MFGVCVDFPHEPRGVIMSLDDFLKKYYKQLHFNSMPSDVRERFDGFVKKDSLTDTMQLWRDKYMHLDKNTGKYVENAIPDVMKDADLPEDVARELFVACQNALVGMNGSLASFKDKNPLAAAFVNEYFGDGNLFNISPASSDCEDGITEIINLIKTNSDVKLYLEDIKDPDDGKTKLFETPGKLDEFISKCDRKEYNTKGGVQAKVKKLAKALKYALFHNEISDELYSQIYPISSKINYVFADSAFSMDPASVDSNKLQEFRNNISHKTGILQVLYKSQKIRDEFAKHDDGTVTSVIDKAENEIDYQKKDSANYVAPKKEDELRPWQQVEKWGADTYNDVFKKYEELRGAPLFFFTESEDVFKAIDKEKIKPVDGLSAVLDKASAIQGRLANTPRSKEYFDWFVETMNDVKKDIPKAVEGAWKDGKQMQCVINQIILKASDPQNKDPHAMEKAMTAMEIMNAMKYGKTTSKIMDAMKSTEFNMFSDSGLSWNKNEGIQFVTKALDKSIKAAFLGIGYGVTITRNQIMLSKGRTKFKDKNNQDGPLSDAFNEQENIVQSEGKVQKKNLKNVISQVRHNKRDIKQDLNDLANEGIDRHTIKGKEQDVKNYKTSLDAQQNNEDTFQQNMSVLREKMNLEKAIAGLTQEVNSTAPDSLQARINQAEAKFRDPNQYTDMPTLVREEKEKELYNEWQQLKQELADKNQELANKNAELTGNAANYTAAKSYIDANRGAHVGYRHTEKDYNSLKEKTEKFRSATADLKEQNKVLKDRNAALKNWDEDHYNKVLRLENFWNMLQSGDTKSYGISAKHAQKKFTNEKRDILLQQMMAQHSLAA